MLKNFICPEPINSITPIETCLKKCPHGERCAPKSYLVMAAEEREWEGVPSVTQLIRGTRESFLKIKNDYSTNPDKAAFRIIGSKGHIELDNHGENTELSMFFEGIKGTLDSIEEEDGTLILVDNKTAGSYKIMLTLGGYSETIETGEFFKNGNPKTKKIYKFDPEQSDLKKEFNEWVLQTNIYKIMYEAKTGKKIDKIKVFMIARDGRTQSAYQRGLFKNTYFVEVPIIDETKIKSYFMRKKEALIKSIETNTIPEPCSPEEAWDGNKCKGYCDVVDFCNSPYL